MLFVCIPELVNMESLLMCCLSLTYWRIIVNKSTICMTLNCTQRCQEYEAGVRIAFMLISSPSNQNNKTVAVHEVSLLPRSSKICTSKRS